MEIRKTALRWTVVGMLLIGLPSTGLAAPDAWITIKTKIALLATEGVSGMAVNVDTVDGRVTLHGTVGSEAEKVKAAEVAQGVVGAREVRDLLQVAPSDAEEADRSIQ